MKKILLGTFLFSSFIAFAQPPAKNEVWMACASKPKLFGLNSSTGELLLKPAYDNLISTEENAWIAQLGDKYGVVDQKGNWIIKPDYPGIYQYRSGKVVASKYIASKDKIGANNGGSYNYYNYGGTRDSVYAYGVADESGVWLIDAKYDFLQLCDDGSVMYTDENGKFGFLNLDGSVMIGARFEWSSRMSGGVAIVAETPKVQNDIIQPYRRYSDRNQARSGEYYLIDKSAQKLNSEPYDVIRVFSEGRAAFNKGGVWRSKPYQQDKLSGGKWGFLDARGKEVIPADYDYVYDFINTAEGPKAKVRIGTRIFWIDVNGKETGPSKELQPVTPVVFCEPGSFGYLGPDNNWVIAPQFFVANDFSEGLAAVMNLRARDLDCTNEDDASSSYNDYANLDYMGVSANPLNFFKSGIKVMSDDEDVRTQQIKDSLDMVERYKRRLYGYIDVTGTIVLEAKYELALPFHNNRAFVKYRGQWGVIDRKGEWVVPPVLDANSTYGDYEGEYSYSYSNINPQDQLSYAINAAYQMGFSEGLAKIFKYGKYGYIDTTGKIIVPPIYDDAQAMENGLAAVCHNGKWGFIDRNGKEVIPLRFISVTAFSNEGYSVAGVNPNKEDMGPPIDGMEYSTEGDVYYGFLDKKGNWFIRPKFSSLSNFSEGLASASQEYGYTGYIDKKGNFVIPPKFSYAYDFDNGFAYAKMSMHEGIYIDKTGKQSKVYNYKNPPPRKNEYFILDYGTNNHYGVKDPAGKELIPHDYTYIGTFVKIK